MKGWPKFLLIFICLLSVSSLFASGANDKKNQTIEIKMGDNLPDRNVGLGAVAEAVNQEFIKIHPEVNFVVESYQDQPYQEKIKIYATAGQLPDIMKYWSFSSFMRPLIDNNMISALDKTQLESYSWLPGALEGNIYDGELYGIPVSADLWVIYYNKAIFDKLNLDPPKTMAQMKSVSQTISDAGYIPMVTDGKDGWPLCITYDNIFWRVNGDLSIMSDVLAGKGHFTDEPFLKAAKAYQDFFLSSGIFNNDLVTTDYGASRNLFGQGQAAMYIMGAWELGMASDQNFSEEFRSNVRAVKFPVFEGGKGQADDLIAWFGGNYIVKSNTENEELIMEYIDLYAKTYAKTMWDLQAGFPAQAVKPSDKDTPLAKDLLAIGSQAKATSGTPTLDRSTPAFKESFQKLCKDLAAGIISPSEFCSDMDKALQKAIQ